MSNTIVIVIHKYSPCAETHDNDGQNEDAHSRLGIRQ